MFNTFSEIIEACKKPTSVILREALSSRINLSPQESDFLIYLAGFTHHEFAEEFYDEFGFIFLKGTSILYDSINNRFHAKVLINDQTDEFNSLDLSNIASTIDSPIFENRIKLRNEKGIYVDNLAKVVLSMSVPDAKYYLSKSKIGIYEQVISYPTVLENINEPLTIHLVIMGQRNIDVNLSAFFERVFACVFINSSYELPNNSLYRIQEKKELYSLLSKIYWFVIDVEKPEKVIDFLSGIEATYRKVPYKGDFYDYFSDLLLDIKTLIANQCSKFLDVNSDSS
jgi:hypothetical protein